MPFVFANDHSSELECAICLSPFESPVELRPCGHVFCRACVVGLNECPECRQSVASRETPNRLIVNMLGQLRGRCSECSWTGSRELYDAGHRTSCTRSQPAPLPSAAPQITSALPSSEHRETRPAPADTPLRRASSQVLDPFGHLGSAWDEYGLTQVEYDEIAAAMAHETVSSVDEAPHASVEAVGIRFEQAIRVARWLNAPSSRDDVKELFLMFSLRPETDRVNLHQFCVWYAAHRRDPTATYGLTNEAYVSALGVFHSQFPTFPDDLSLNARKAGAVASHVLGRPVSEAEVQQFLGAKTALSLHELLVDLQSAHDGWEVCAAPRESPAATSAPQSQSEEPARKQGFFSKLFSRKRSDTTQARPTASPPPQTQLHSTVARQVVLTPTQIAPQRTPPNVPPQAQRSAIARQPMLIPTGAPHRGPPVAYYVPTAQPQGRVVPGQPGYPGTVYAGPSAAPVVYRSVQRPRGSTYSPAQQQQQCAQQ